MGLDGELRTYLRRVAPGEYTLQSEDGSIVIRGRTYGEVRRDLDVLLRADPSMDEDVTVMVYIGTPPRSPAVERIPASPISSSSLCPVA